MIQYQIPWTEEFSLLRFQEWRVCFCMAFKEKLPPRGFLCSPSCMNKPWRNNRFSIWKVSLPKIKWKDTPKHEYRQHTLRVFVCVTNDYHISDITFLRGRGESSGVHPEATSSPLTSTSTRLETSGGWDIMRSI